MNPSNLIKCGVSALLAVSALTSAPLSEAFPSVLTSVSAESEKLAAPANIKSTAYAVKIKLTWDKVRDATGYRVFMYDEASKKFTKYKNVTELSCIITGLEPNKTYRFKVSALKTNGNKYELQTLSDEIEVKTKKLSIPKAPSENFTGLAGKNGKTYCFENGVAVVGRTSSIKGKLYLLGEDGLLLKDGLHTINGVKYYSDKNGVVASSTWMTLKNNTYYYAGKDGKITEYSLASDGRTASYLKINGEYAKPQDIPYWNGNTKYAYYRFANDYYRLYMNTDRIYTAQGDESLFNGAPAFDMATGMQIGNFRGYPVMDETGFICGGKVFNTAEGRVLSFSGKGKAPASEKAGELLVFCKRAARNSEGKIDFSFEVVNNTGKDIKEITYTVYGIDSTGKKVRDVGNSDFNFYLLDSTPISYREAGFPAWDSAFSSKEASDIEIRGAKVIFADGSKKILSAAKITLL